MTPALARVMKMAEVKKKYIMLWGCFLASGPGDLSKVNGIMKKDDYIWILNRNVWQLGQHWTSQHDDDPKKQQQW